MRLLTLKSGLWAERTSLQCLNCSYDAAGNVITILDAKNSNQKQCSTDDLIHCLTNATTYDAAGRTTQIVREPGSLTSSYSYYG